YIIENPLIDYVMHENESFLAKLDARPGTMQLVEHATFQAIIQASCGYTIVPGGSGANTARALAMLTGDEQASPRPCYSGGVGDDEAGRAFETIMSGLGIDTAMAMKNAKTGVSAIVVTPDHERTMFTSLGACRDFSPGDVSEEFLADSACFYATGYLWDTDPQKQALFHAVDRANALDIPVYFDLADPFVVDRYWKDLCAWLPGRVHTIFANRQELSRMTGCGGTDYEIMRDAARLAPTVVMKIGRGGCLAQSGGRLIHVKGEAVVPVDTTGAGDSFSAGFLYGVLHHRSLKDCAKLGNRIAARVVAVEGCRYDCIDRDDILAVVTA
ncbi:MAG: adenosine kinase, partial [Spirochaetales bacterium]